MSNEPNIGKHAFESLTTGMYADPKIIYREYIQNSTDAIDDAIKTGQLRSGNEGKIEININKNEKQISIKDNGTGISVTEVYNVLCDVGNSRKHFEENRGFRGIGRLGGLTYADEVFFVTSCIGEPQKSVLRWDCIRLRELLQPGKYDEYDIHQVIKEVTTLEFQPESANNHYFEVVLKNVDDKKHPELLSEEIIENYLCQVAPIPFNAQKFYFYNDVNDGIKSNIKRLRKQIEEYNIYLNGNPNPLYKPYRSWYNTGNKEKSRDEITGIEFFEERTEQGELLFWGWYAISNFYGQVKDEEFAGLRIRKSNILIGDSRTLNDFFIERRFNKYFIGEVYVYDNGIIPNARRDDFEKNENYYLFKERLEKYTREKLSKWTRLYSGINSAINHIEKGEKKLEEIAKKVNDGVTSNEEKKILIQQKEQISKKVEQSKKELEKSKDKIDNSKVKQNIEQTIKKTANIEQKTKEVDKKINKVNYSLDKDKTLSSYSRNEKKVIYTILEVIDKELDQNVANKLKEKIFLELRPKSKEVEKNK